MPVGSTHEPPHALFDKRDHVATITLNRPERGNAMTPAMKALVADMWEEIRDDPWIRCVIITGAGDRHLCTGADVTAAAADGRPQDRFGTVKEDLRWTARQAEVWKPTICAVNGMVAGGGLHFVVDSDIVVASERATFLDTHVNVGMVGALENIGLAKRLPLGTALRMTLQGKSFRLSAERAHQLGLVEEVVAPDQLMETATAIAHDICQSSPAAVSLSLRAMWASLEMPYSQALEHGYALLRMHWMHPDYVEGPKAFAEKRDPRWTAGLAD